MARLGSAVKKDEIYRRNASAMESLLKVLSDRSTSAKNGGGAEPLKRLHDRGKLSARERITQLIDPESTFVEVGLLAADGMYREYGGAPSAGVVVGIGRVSNRLCVIVANDATVKAGAWFPMTCKKNLRAQEIALSNRIPILYLVDSAGIFLPLQSEIFADADHFGRIFRNNAILSAEGIPQLSAIMGPCVAGGAYLPIMSDEALIVQDTGSVFLAGPHLVKAAIGEETSTESLGGATTHSEISGVTDYKCANDQEAIATLRSLVSKFAHPQKFGFDRIAPRTPDFDPQEISGIIPADRTRQYDTHQILARLLDASEFDEYKAGYGKTIITGYGRIDGWAVGIVANQRSVVRARNGEMQVGGVIYSDSADKATRFILNCNQKGIPLVFLQDVTGFMVGTRAEQGGIIKDGAKMVNAVANSVVPKFTVVTGNSYGAGNYAMCGRAYDPRLFLAWPSAQIAVMGGKQASETLLSIRLGQLERKGESISDAERTSLLTEIQQRYEMETNPFYAASRLWVDGIIDPADTRMVISHGIEAADCNNSRHGFNNGVIQV